MMQSNSDDKDECIYYQLCIGPQELEVDGIEMSESELGSKKVLFLRNAIHEREQLQCRPRDLRIYARGTTMENYQNEQHLEIDTSLNDEGIQGTSRASPILVVISAPTPPVPPANDAIVLANDEVSTQTMQLRNLASRILKILTFLIVHVYIFS
jgi:hypothetical protein